MLTAIAVLLYLSFNTLWNEAAMHD